MKAFHLVAKYLRDQGWNVAWGKNYRQPFSNSSGVVQVQGRKLNISKRRGKTVSITVNQTKMSLHCKEWSLCDPEGLPKLEKTLEICMRYKACHNCVRYSLKLQEGMKK